MSFKHKDHAAYDDWDRLLAERFPPRSPNSGQRDWDKVRESFSVGQPVSGVVVSRAHFGVWMDIGAGFPTILLIPDVAGLTPDRYQAGDWRPIGSTQLAQIVLFNDVDHQIRVAQGIPHENRA